MAVWKIVLWSLAGVAALTPLIIFLVQRMRASYAEKHGVAMYATVTGYEPVKAFGRVSEVMKITLALQESGKSMREVVIQSRVPADAKIQKGAMLPIVIDPKNPKRVYPAGEKALKRVVLTGSREQRRQMKKQRM
jgi:hypothetical protein